MIYEIILLPEAERHLEEWQNSIKINHTNQYVIKYSITE